MTNLFGEETVDEALRERLVNAYAARLLLRPPIPSLSPTNHDRIALADKLARKDVDRLLSVMAQMGLSIVERK